jgi:ATP-dependent RNA circularization protein (DNA/RNA ligase family)
MQDSRAKIIQIGCNRHFETMAFHAKWDGRYFDADVQRQIYFKSDWAIADQDADDRANDMHEAVISELICRMENGEQFENADDQAPGMNN